MPRMYDDGVHTIPVPRSWTPEQAWEEIKRGILLKDPHPGWANVIIKDGQLRGTTGETIRGRSSNAREEEE